MQNPQYIETLTFNDGKNYVEYKFSFKNSFMELRPPPLVGMLEG